VTTKEPVLLVVLVEMQHLRWNAAGISLNGTVIPLLRSDDRNLDAYLGKSLDEQVSFLRHRFCGVLQRATDRLWGREQKPCQIVFVLDGFFPEAATELTQQVAVHLADWLTRPPVAFLLHRGPIAPDDDMATNRLAGDIPEAHIRTMTESLPQLVAAREDASQWELCLKPRRSE
jgi:hypothetical protein